MTLEPDAGPIEQILEIAGRALFSDNGSSAAAKRLQLSVRLFLQETRDVDAAMAIVIAVGDELGLVPRDHGQFAPRKTAHPIAAEVSTATVSTPVGSADDDEDLKNVASSEARIQVSESSSAIASAEDQARSVSSHEQTKPDVSGAESEGEVFASPSGKTAKQATEPFVQRSPSAAKLKSRAGHKERLLANEVFKRTMGSGRPIGGYRFSELHTAELSSKKDARVFKKIREYGVPPGDPTVAEYFPAEMLEAIIGKERKPRRARKN